jgi:hypothetical protein
MTHVKELPDLRNLNKLQLMVSHSDDGLNAYIIRNLCSRTSNYDLRSFQN